MPSSEIEPVAAFTAQGLGQLLARPLGHLMAWQHVSVEFDDCRSENVAWIHHM